MSREHRRRLRAGAAVIVCCFCCCRDASGIVAGDDADGEAGEVLRGDIVGDGIEEEGATSIGEYLLVWCLSYLRSFNVS
jgi:hypothetical protein